MDKYFSEIELIKFIKWYIKKHLNLFNQLFEEYEDGFQDVFLYVFRKLHYYDTKYSKGTFLNMVCDSAFLYYQRINNCDKRKTHKSTISIYEPIEVGSDVMIEDIIQDETDYFEKISNKFDFEKFKPFLNNDAKEFFLKEKSIYEISKERGVCYEAIRKSIAKNIKNIKKGTLFGKRKNAAAIGFYFNKFTDEEKKYFNKPISEIAKDLNTSTRSVYRKRKTILERYKRKDYARNG